MEQAFSHRRFLLFRKSDKTECLQSMIKLSANLYRKINKLFKPLKSVGKRISITENA